jgi:hypothetical protein
MGDAGGIFRLHTKITLGCHTPIFQIGFYNTEGTDHNTHPTAHTSISVVKGIPCLFIQIHGTGKTCLNTRGVFTVAALEGKGYMTLLLEYDS